MDLSSVILGPIVTEKAEKLKQANAYVLRVHPHATKVDVKNALKRFYDTSVKSVRVLNTVPKSRHIGGNRYMEKRHRAKRMIVTLGAKSKALDLAKFQVS